MNLSIGRRLFIGYALALIALIAIALTSYSSTTHLVNAENLRKQSRQVLHSLDGIMLDLANAETGQRGFLLAGEERYLDPYQSAVQSLPRRIADSRRALANDRSQQIRLDELQSLVQAKLAELNETIDLRRKKGFSAALEVVMTHRGERTMENIRNLIDQLQSTQAEVVNDYERLTNESASAMKSMILFGSIGAALLVAAVAFAVYRSITHPLRDFTEMVEKIGHGDLRQEVRISGNDELARLGTSLNRMVAALKGMAEQTRIATQNLGSAAAEILASTQQQVAGSGEQAAAVQQTTATMEEIRQAGIQIAERAKQVAASAQTTALSSSSGLKAVQDTNRAIQSIRDQAEAVAENIVRLSEKTQAIGDIVTTVNELSEQSHLLALNAAIQAAAAGEHGRTFSVVAREIKNLADQSKEATVQVRSILGEIQRGINSSVMLTEEAVKRVESGKQHSDLADRTIRDMAENLQQSVQAFQQIVAGSNQQQIGFEQVLQAVKNIGQATHQTASATRQLEKAASNLNTLGRELKASGEIYRI